jgi:hypothetical protein
VPGPEEAATVGANDAATGGFTPADGGPEIVPGSDCALPCADRVTVLGTVQPIQNTTPIVTASMLSLITIDCHIQTSFQQSAVSFQLFLTADS